VTYGPEPLQFADVRLPSSTTFRVAAVIHGGYWKATYNLIHTGHMCAALAAADVATWNLEYRRVGDVGGGWPAAAEDVALALELMAGEGGMPAELLIGHSAGGHLALLAAKRFGVPVVALAPVSDLVDSACRTGADGAPARFMGGMPDEVPERYAAASPRVQLPLGVRHILIHGTADEVVPYAMSEAYVKDAGGEAELITLEGTGHFELIDPQAREFGHTLEAVRTLLA
jgi:acetyl esterase/lipase